MSKLYSRIVRPVMGVSLCAGAAGLSSALFGARASSAWLPIIFIAIVFLIAIRFGTLVGIFGALAAALVFAYTLFPPLGRVAVADETARGNIGWMLLGSIVISFLVAPGMHQRHGR